MPHDLRDVIETSAEEKVIQVSYIQRDKGKVYARRVWYRGDHMQMRR